MEKSSQVVERAAAVLPNLRHGGCGPTAVVEESLHVVFQF
jgi:hypothetical protein